MFGRLYVPASVCVCVCMSLCLCLCPCLFVICFCKSAGSCSACVLPHTYSGEGRDAAIHGCSGKAHVLAAVPLLPRSNRWRGNHRAEVSRVMSV